MGRTILICDDHDVLRRLLRKSLESIWDQPGILEAKDGEEALRLARQTKPDLVVMDIALPGMNGIEATRAIKGLYPDTHVIILTVHELDAYRSDAADAGADAYIPKRHMQTRLLESIESIFG